MKKPTKQSSTFWENELQGFPSCKDFHNPSGFPMQHLDNLMTWENELQGFVPFKILYLQSFES